MIYGNPTLFSISYDVIEYSDDNYWKFGILNFIIDDEIYPAKGSNYTLHMAFNYLKDSGIEISNTRPFDINLNINDIELISVLAHSHGMLLDTDSDDMELPEINPIGVFLSPLEIADVGFYLFYLLINNNTEALIYSADYGVSAKKIELPKGTVNKVISELPEKNFI
ncbi:immunity 42 family protein [Photorhabdus bodei]|uniref:Immunity protein 42 n=1 Tax=Photorhabdus bodei TaxID=2029681 RepID=A0A329WQ55_9GAMM|nr:immunity 42 family protein [Photorhabdus bodei]RAX06691.1 hypothetical protein CKY02_22320 [Photorhabdus bodei]